MIGDRIVGVVGRHPLLAVTLTSNIATHMSNVVDGVASVIYARAAHASGFAVGSPVASPNLWVVTRCPRVRKG